MQRREAKIGLRERKRHRRPKKRNDTGENPADERISCKILLAWIGARIGLQDPPTVKPTAMLQDALIDLTNRGEIVLDPFLGSGSTLIAAKNSGRVCCGVEFDPLCVDVTIRRYEKKAGAAVILAESGETFEKLAARRRNDERDGRPSG
jgi:DNA modification methylase